MSSKLTPLQQRVFDLLDAKPNTDVPLASLFCAAYDPDMAMVYLPKSRDMQQKLGPLLARINAKLKRGVVEPGKMKQTYRLTIKKD